MTPRLIAEFLLLGFAPLSWLIRINGGSKPTSRSVAILAGSLCVFLYHFCFFFFLFSHWSSQIYSKYVFLFFPISSPVFFGGWGVEDSWHPTGTSPGPGGGLIPVYFITMMSQLHMIICMLYRCYITIFDNYRTISNH